MASASSADPPLASHAAILAQNTMPFAPSAAPHARTRELVLWGHVNVTCEYSGVIADERRGVRCEHSLGSTLRTVKMEYL